MDHIRRLAEVGVIPPEEWAPLEPVLAQLKHISGKRNTILHYGAVDVAEGRGLVTDAMVALTMERVKSFPISPDILSDMTDDLNKIFIHLLMRHAGRPVLRANHPGLDEILRAAWRYIPPQPKKNHRPPNGKRTKPKRQPSPSQA
jgi:hypothetical protein